MESRLEILVSKKVSCRSDCVAELKAALMIISSVTDDLQPNKVTTIRDDEWRIQSRYLRCSRNKLGSCKAAMCADLCANSNQWQCVQVRTSSITFRLNLTRERQCYIIIIGRQTRATIRNRFKYINYNIFTIENAEHSISL